MLLVTCENVGSHFASQSLCRLLCKMGIIEAATRAGWMIQGSGSESKTLLTASQLSSPAVSVPVTLIAVRALFKHGDDGVFLAMVMTRTGAQSQA